MTTSSRAAASLAAYPLNGQKKARTLAITRA